MSKRELARVEVLARVRSKQLRVVDAGRLMRVSYRQSEATVEALSRGRGCRAAAPQRGAAFESPVAREEVSAEGARAGAGEVRGSWKKLARWKIQEVVKSMQRAKRLKSLLEHLLDCRCVSLNVCVQRLMLSPRCARYGPESVGKHDSPSNFPKSQ